MLILEIALISGGISKPRNDMIMRMFRLLGESERQGFGGSQIFKYTIESGYKTSQLLSNLNTTKLNLWSTNFSSIYSELSDLEQKVFDFINKSQEEGVSKPIIEERFDLSDHDTRNL